MRIFWIKNLDEFINKQFFLKIFFAFLMMF